MKTLSFYPVIEIIIHNYWDLVRKEVGFLKKTLAYRLKNEITKKDVELTIRNRIIEGLRQDFVSELEESVQNQLHEHGVISVTKAHIEHFGLISENLNFYFKFNLDLEILNHRELIFLHKGDNLCNRLILFFFKEKAFSRVEDTILENLVKDLPGDLGTKLKNSLEEKLGENKVVSSITVHVHSEIPFRAGTL